MMRELIGERRKRKADIGGRRKEKIFPDSAGSDTSAALESQVGDRERT